MHENKHSIFVVCMDILISSSEQWNTTLLVCVMLAADLNTANYYFWVIHLNVSVVRL